MVSRQEKTKNHHALQNRQQQKIRNAVPATGSLGPQLSLPLFLPLGNGLQGHFHTADGDPVLFFNGADMYLFPIDEHAILGAGIRNGPASIIVTGQNRMVPGYRRKIDGHIAGFAAADDIFPMGNRDLGSVRHVQPRPDLWLPPEGQQRFHAAQQQKHRQNRCRIAQKTDIYQQIIPADCRKLVQKRFHVITVLSSLKD